MRRFLVALLFIAGCAHDHSHEKVEARPYIVVLRDDVDVELFIDEHYLEPAQRLPIIHGFSADLRPATVDALRDDERVARMTENHATNALTDRHDDDDHE
jgi:hypothetical protein